MAERRITLGPCGDLAEIPDVEVRGVDTPAGPMVEIAMLSTDYCWRARSWWQPEQARRIAERILAAAAGVAAGPQATPPFCGSDLGEYGCCELTPGHDGDHAGAGPQATPDQVLWEGPTFHVGHPSKIDVDRQPLVSQVQTGEIDTPPGTRVRVVAVPTDHEDQPRCGFG